MSVFLFIKISSQDENISLRSEIDLLSHSLGRLNGTLELLLPVYEGMAAQFLAVQTSCDKTFPVKGKIPPHDNAQ